MKRYTSNLFYIFFLSMFCVSAYADNATDLSALLNGVQSMRANFSQTVYDNRGKVLQHSTGQMAMQRPGKFRWNVVKPIPQLVIANGTRLWIYDPDLQQVTIRSLKKAAGETPALLLSNASTNVEKDFNVKETTAKAGLRWFNLTPKAADNLFESVQMGFKDNHISEMRLKDNLGHVTRIEYKQSQYNVNLPSTQFVFSPPAGVDVINETAKR